MMRQRFLPLLFAFDKKVIENLVVSKVKINVVKEYLYRMLCFASVR
jgi:hypothetical protein